MRKCTKCGMENKASANFCGNCGARLPTEAPTGVQEPENVVSAAWRAAKTSGKQKKPWIKAVVLAFVLIIAVLLFKGLGQLRSCPDCKEIQGLQKELQAALKENEDNSLREKDYERWSTKVSALSSEILLLQNHECGMPVRKVKNQEYAYGRYAGTYTGEWRSTFPYGEGSFSGAYMEGSTRYDITYFGEWSAGTPNGTGALVQHRAYLDAASPENWYSHLYEGTFVNGKLTGTGWYSTESSTGDRYEYYNGFYNEGFLEGQANFLQYKDGELYDQGIVEGSQCVVVYSMRREIVNTLETAVGLAIAGVAVKSFADMLDSAMGNLDPNSSAGKWLEEQHEMHAASMEEWREKKASAEQLRDTWQALEAKVKWYETSKYPEDREKAEYYRIEAEKAKKAYYAAR